MIISEPIDDILVSIYIEDVEIECDYIEINDLSLTLKFDTDKYESFIKLMPLYDGINSVRTYKKNIDIYFKGYINNFIGCFVQSIDYYENSDECVVDMTCDYYQVVDDRAKLRNELIDEILEM